MKSPVKFKYFLLQAYVLAKSIGLIPYTDETHPERFPLLMNLVFIILIVNMNFVLLIEFMFIVMSVVKGEHFAEATMNLAYFGFTFVTNIKIISVLQKKSLLTVLMRNLKEIYPNDTKLQNEFQCQRYVFKYNLISLCFVCVHEILIWWYCLYPAVRFLVYDYLLHWEVVPKTLPYYVWVPWQWQNHWSYYYLYISLAMASHMAMSGQLANDLILCAVATQITMHYRYLAQRLQSYQPCEIYDRNQRFLAECIQYHQTILSLSSYMNEIFGVSLLVNFVSSSFIMCFLSFQMTIGVQTDALMMLFLFLFCSLLQIYMICSYGEQLIEKSERIGHAVYQHNWLNTDTRFQKMLILIIERSQRPALLKATRFLKVSMATMTDLMQLSYKFYALIRTIYAK